MLAVGKMFGAKERVVIRFNRQGLAMEGERGVLFTRLIDGIFPNVEPLIPNACAHIIGVQKDAFADAVRQVALMSREKIKPLKLTSIPRAGDGAAGMLRLESERAEYGDLTLEVPAYADGEVAIGFNAAYVLDVLRAMPDGVVMLGLTGPLHPAVFACPATPGLTSVVMPLKIEW